MIELHLLNQRLRDKIPINPDNIDLATSVENAFPNSMLSSRDRETTCHVKVGYQGVTNPSVIQEEALSVPFSNNSLLSCTIAVMLYAPTEHFLWLWRNVYNALNMWYPKEHQDYVTEQHQSLGYYSGEIYSLHNGIYQWVDLWRLDIFKIPTEVIPTPPA